MCVYCISFSKRNSHSMPKFHSFKGIVWHIWTVFSFLLWGRQENWDQCHVCTVNMKPGKLKDYYGLKLEFLVPEIWFYVSGPHVVLDTHIHMKPHNMHADTRNISGILTHLKYSTTFLMQDPAFVKVLTYCNFPTNFAAEDSQCNSQVSVI